MSFKPRLTRQVKPGSRHCTGLGCSYSSQGRAGALRKLVPLKLVRPRPEDCTSWSAFRACKAGPGTTQIGVLSLSLQSRAWALRRVRVLLELARPRPGPAASWRAREARAAQSGGARRHSLLKGGFRGENTVPRLCPARGCVAGRAPHALRSAHVTRRAPIAARLATSRPSPRARRPLPSHASAAAGQQTPAAGWSWTAWPAS